MAVAAEALEQSMLESKDKDQLLAIAQALGIKTTARAAKATLIDKILETTGAGLARRRRTAVDATARATKARERRRRRRRSTADADSGRRRPPTNRRPAARQPTPAVDSRVILGADGEPLADWEIELIKLGRDAGELAASPASPRLARGRHVAIGDDGAATTTTDDDGQAARAGRREPQQPPPAPPAQQERPRRRAAGRATASTVHAIVRTSAGPIAAARRSAPSASASRPSRSTRSR